MGFEEVVARDLQQKDFGSLRYVMQYKERSHISASKVDEFGSSVYVDVDSSAIARYSDGGTPAYLAAKNLSYDWLVTLYDINSCTGGLWRIYKKGCIGGLEKFEKGLGRRANIEARVIGLQNGHNTPTVKNVLSHLTEQNIPVMEVDLFGDELRHIAFDLKRGMTFDMLLENRIYRPGELKNGLTADQFEAQTKTKAKPKQ